MTTVIRDVSKCDQSSRLGRRHPNFVVALQALLFRPPSAGERSALHECEHGVRRGRSADDQRSRADT